jgi:hypothetical protein
MYKKKTVAWQNIESDSSREQKFALEFYASYVSKDHKLPSLAVEIGSHYGATAAVLSQFFDRVICIDPWWMPVEDHKYDQTRLDLDRIAGFYRNLVTHNLSNITPILSTSQILQVMNCKSGLVFIDGDHSESAVTLDIDYSDSTLEVNGLLVFHDYHETWPGVKSAVDQSQILKWNYVVFETRKDGMICFKKIADIPRPQK